MPLSPERTEHLLAEIEQHLVSAMHAHLPLGGAPPHALTVSEVDGVETLGMVPILDVRDRFPVLAQAVASTTADGFVFVYDGFIRNADLMDVEAVLVVVGNRYAGTRAYATPYRRTAGQVTVLPVLPAPPDVTQAYANIFR